MPKQAEPAPPDLAALAAELAVLRRRVERLERAAAQRNAAPGTRPAAPAKAQRNSALGRDEPRQRIEPREPWNLSPPELSGKRRT